VSGLCAVVHHDDTPIHPTTLPRMTEAAPHRGPATTHTTPHAHLAHHTHHYERPHTQGHTTIIASARIDNRDDLLPHLRPHLAGPHPTDAELILAAHHHWGDDAPQHLIGDYAYLIHDAHRRTLHAARDAMGMRPLYYHHTPRRTLLASEIQQLLAAGDVAAEIHEPAVARYLIGEFGVPDETFYRGVRSLPAGHALEADARGVRTRRFWDVDPARRERFAREEDYAERFRGLFLRAVQDRLRGDEPVGLFLSGGVDSGSIASAAGWLREQGRVSAPMHAYPWAFDTLTQCDERHLSDLVVKRYALPVHEVAAEASAPLARYPNHGPHRDEPYVGAYQALLENGLAAARDDGMRSMWSGDRGDLVAGAWTLDYLRLLRSRRWNDLAYEMRDQLGLPGERWHRVVATHLLLPAARAVARRVLQRRSGRAAPRAGHREPPWLRHDLMARSGVDPDVERAPEPPAALEGHARRTRYGLVFIPMHMRGMIWSERTNAAFGLGFVDPWSDRRLIEYVLSIPQAVINRPGELRKRLARAAMRGIMPEELRQNAAKIVPSPLFDQALRRTGVDTVRTLLTDMEAERRGYLDGDALRAHYEGVVAGGGAHVTLWWALTLEMWLRRWWT
jgi:asparagine synthase (glutamine-hydrolysing)